MPSHADKAIAVVTIDGPAASGKGTVAKAVAHRLSFNYLDSGLLYRAMAVLLTEQGINLNDSAGVAGAVIGLIDCLPEATKDPKIMTPAIAKAAATIAQQASVRQALLRAQKQCQQSPGLVADGRDMGNVVFPDAPLKAFLTATLDARAHRRQLQLRQQGIYAKMGDVRVDIGWRDNQDNHRLQAIRSCCEQGGLVIDSTNLTVDEIVNSIVDAFSRCRFD